MHDETTISPDGVGEENVANYYLWTWRQLTVLFGALKQNGIFDAAGHPRYQAACRFWIEILTPPQPKLAAFAASDPIQPRQRRRRMTSPGGLAVDYVVAAAGPTSTQAGDFRFTGRYGVAYYWPSCDGFDLRRGTVAWRYDDGFDLHHLDIRESTNTAISLSSGLDLPRHEVLRND